MKIGFALLLNDECHNYIREIQLELHQKFGTHLARQTPHITIKSPFDVPQPFQSLAPFYAYVESLAKQTKPFEIFFDGFNSFGQNVFFLDVVANPALHQLHKKILNDVQVHFGLTPHAFEGEKVKFHASVAGFQEEEKFEKVRSFLAGYQPKFSFQANRLAVFYYLGTGNGWIVNRIIKMENGEWKMENGE